MSELKTNFEKTIVPALAKKLGIKNPLAVPRLRKIVVNIGVNKEEDTPKRIEVFKEELRTITGQEPKVTSAKKSIAGFNIRQGDPVGLAVTLRGNKMFDFFEKLCRIVLPQVKDFRGVKRNAFDGQGNYTLGFSEQIVFPEIDYSKVDIVHGLEATFVTSTDKDEEARMLLTHLGMPFEKEEKNG